MLKARGLPIQTVLTGVLVLLILVAAGAVGASATVATQRGLQDSWHRQADGLAEATVQEVTGFLAAAEPVTAQASVLDVSDTERLQTWLDGALEANPNFTWLAYAGSDGSYTASMRWPEGNTVELRRTRRVQTVQGTWQRDWRRSDRGLEQVVDRYTDYDPRLRPFWGAAPEGRWVDPYLFLSRQQPGVSFARGRYATDGTLEGVFIADFECGVLSDFLARLDETESGRVYVVDGTGRVIAHPHGLVAANDEILNAADHVDPWLNSGWGALVDSGFVEGPFSVDGLEGSARRFPEDMGVPWWVLVVVPHDQLYGPAVAQAKQSLALTFAVVLVATIIGLVFSRRLSHAIARVERELRRIARFELTRTELGESSVFTEVNALALAHDRMKRSLRNFGRYVPRGLVERMLQTGEEARLGAEVREVSVLFCAITGFDDLVEANTPADLFEGLSDFLERIDVCIHADGGTVSQYLGDASMAFWGAPDDQPDHAIRAGRAALAMLEAIDARTLHPALPVTIGVNTGDCLAGNIGAEERFNFNILGDPVNTAARIKGLNSVYGTRLLIGEETAAQIGDALLVRPVDWVRMKGKTRPVLVHELLPDDGNPRRRAGVDLYREALDAYREGRFERAADLFERTPWAEPMAARARAYQSNPPPPDWDGSFTMRTK
jgi:adenylate cyclase